MGKKNKRVRPDDPVKCIAHSSRTGNPCQRPPMKGQNVCFHHGGAASAARRRAAERIALASDKAAAQLFAFMHDERVPHNVRLAAAKDLLDRANVIGKTTVEIELKPWEKLLQGADGIDGIVATLPAGGDTAMRPFAESQSEEALQVASERFDAETVEAERAETAREMERYREANQDRSRPRPHEEPATPTLNGDDRPPPRHPTPGPRRIEPDDDRPRPRRRVAGRR